MEATVNHTFHLCYHKTAEDPVRKNFSQDTSPTLCMHNSLKKEEAQGIILWAVIGIPSKDH